MLRGTRIIEGKDAENFVNVCDSLRQYSRSLNLKEAIIPAIWGEGTFSGKIGPENQSMMWRFQDKKQRNVCLIPEATAIFQERYRKSNKPESLFYITRCYRYERPQKGRYREFTQFGVELLGQGGNQEAIGIMTGAFTHLVNEGHLREMPNFQFDVKRGLDYYVGDGFEATIETLGAQKQVAGGGVYKEGCGFAIGIDRLLLEHP